MSMKERWARIDPLWGLFVTLVVLGGIACVAVLGGVGT
jgi:hypothetical protein